MGACACARRPQDWCVPGHTRWGHTEWGQRGQRPRQGSWGSPAQPVSPSSPSLIPIPHPRPHPSSRPSSPPLSWSSPHPSSPHSSSLLIFPTLIPIHILILILHSHPSSLPLIPVPHPQPSLPSPSQLRSWEEGSSTLSRAQRAAWCGRRAHHSCPLADLLGGTHGRLSPGTCRSQGQGGCIGASHEDLLGGAMERLVHEIHAVSDHGADPLAKPWEKGARMQEGSPPGSGLTPSSSKFLPCEALGWHASLWVHPCLHLGPQRREAGGAGVRPWRFQKGSVCPDILLSPACSVPLAVSWDTSRAPAQWQGWPLSPSMSIPPLHPSSSELGCLCLLPQTGRVCL